MMSDMLQFLLKYGFLVVFGAAFGEQVGLPIPAATLLIGMGALSRAGNFDFAAVVALAVSAGLAADLIWYELGRRHGRSVLRLLCRISLEPDYCARRTEDAFERLGLWSLLPAKFIPGFNAATVPFAGMIKTPLIRFLAIDIVAVTMWSGTYTLVGYVFNRETERILIYLSRLGTLLFFFMAIAVGLYLGYKIHQRRRFLKKLSVARITPEELKAKMDAKESILILDMRNRLDRSADPVRIPGAFHVLPEHIDFRREDIAPKQEIVVYCTCPNEATGARVALQLQRRGLSHARPLLGGLDAWRERDFPVEVLD
jgi:membrane protein DedA with SNARE-associated domain/rhodanese-related sulfurtransferase